MKSLINIKTIVAITLLSVTSVSTHAAECPDLLKFVKRKLNHLVICLDSTTI